MKGKPSMRPPSTRPGPAAPSVLKTDLVLGTQKKKGEVGLGVGEGLLGFVFGVHQCFSLRENKKSPLALRVFQASPLNSYFFIFILAPPPPQKINKYRTET